MNEQLPSEEKFRDVNAVEICAVECCVGDTNQRVLIAGRCLGPNEARALRDWLNKALPSTYPGEGIAWADFLHHRARVIDWKHDDGADDVEIAKTLSMDPLQVRLIRMRDRSVP